MLVNKLIIRVIFIQTIFEILRWTFERRRIRGWGQPLFDILSILWSSNLWWRISSLFCLRPKIACRKVSLSGKNQHYADLYFQAWRFDTIEFTRSLYVSLLIIHLWKAWAYFFHDIHVVESGSWRLWGCCLLALGKLQFLKFVTF